MLPDNPAVCSDKKVCRNRDVLARGRAFFVQHSITPNDLAALIREYFEWELILLNHVAIARRRIDADGDQLAAARYQLVVNGPEPAEL